MLAETLPGLEQRRAQALAAVDRVRGNPALRDELREWFSAWLAGYYTLSRERQRDFLFAVKARVLLWREGEHTPRAQLVIDLPTAPMALPPPPPIPTAKTPRPVPGRSISIWRTARSLPPSSESGKTCR